VHFVKLCVELFASLLALRQTANAG
jgi:hypothetical protein